MDYPGGANEIKRALKCGRGYQKNAIRERLDRMTVTDFEDEGGHGCELPVKSRKCKNMDSSLEPLERSTLLLTL